MCLGVLADELHLLGQRVAALLHSSCFRLNHHPASCRLPLRPHSISYPNPVRSFWQTHRTVLRTTHHRFPKPIARSLSDHNDNKRRKVYRDGKSRAVLPTELEALEYLKKSALRHAESDYVIEKREIIFDSHENAGDKKRLTELRQPQRKPERDNSIHASIHT